MPKPDAALSGPDFLDAVADAESAHGNEINAAEYRRRARQWRRDQHALMNAEAAIATALSSPPRTTARNHGGAITPTDSRR